MRELRRLGESVHGGANRSNFEPILFIYVTNAFLTPVPRRVFTADDDKEVRQRRGKDRARLSSASLAELKNALRIGNPTSFSLTTCSMNEASLLIVGGLYQSFAPMGIIAMVCHRRR